LINNILITGGRRQ